MAKKILLIRTFKDVGIGGPVPPLSLLYVASTIMKFFKDKYELKLIDMGIGYLALDNIKNELDGFYPDIIVLSGLVWEADLVHSIAALVKKLNKRIIVIVEGQLASIAKEYLLQDENIDLSIIGEAEISIIELLMALENQVALSKVNGIIYRAGDKIISNKPRAYIENLDEITISSSAWDLIKIREYAKYPNWNGALKESFYAPILASRGCPFDCTFCCNREVSGKRFRARSPENVLTEMMLLHSKYGVKEIHIFDAVFNYDIERAKRICRLIIESDVNFSLAFPHGIRADIMTDELITLLRKAGTYKLVYGIETAVPRLQRLIQKNLDIHRVKEIISKTTQKGIIVGGYFMLGFPTETRQEMLQTMDFAVNSDLDLAYFFKVTDYQKIIQFYQSWDGKKENLKDCENLCYYSRKRSSTELPSSALNDLILQAQQRFFLKPKRFFRLMRKSLFKTRFLKNSFTMCGLILQSYLIRKLDKVKSNFH